MRFLKQLDFASPEALHRGPHARMLPPGRARLVTEPVATGARLAPWPMGITLVAPLGLNRRRENRDDDTTFKPTSPRARAFARSARPLPIAIRQGCSASPTRVPSPGERTRNSYVLRWRSATDSGTFFAGARPGGERRGEEPPATVPIGTLASTTKSSLAAVLEGRGGAASSEPYYSRVTCGSYHDTGLGTQSLMAPPRWPDRAGPPHSQSIHPRCGREVAQIKGFRVEKSSTWAGRSQPTSYVNWCGPRRRSFPLPLADGRVTSLFRVDPFRDLRDDLLLDPVEAMVGHGFGRGPRFIPTSNVSSSLRGTAVQIHVHRAFAIEIVTEATASRCDARRATGAVRWPTAGQETGRTCPGR